MVAFLLFLILVVLLYATGLLPGVIKVIAGVLAIALVLFAAALFGWPLVIGGFVAALVVAGAGVWLTFSIASKKGQESDSDRQRRIDKSHAELKQMRDEKEAAKQRAIQEQVSITNSIGKK